MKLLSKQLHMTRYINALVIPELRRWPNRPCTGSEFRGPSCASACHLASYSSVVISYQVSRQRSTRDTTPWKRKHAFEDLELGFWKSSCSNMFCSDAKTKITYIWKAFKKFMELHHLGSGWSVTSGQEITILDFASMAPPNAYLVYNSWGN